VPGRVARSTERDYEFLTKLESCHAVGHNRTERVLAIDATLRILGGVATYLLTDNDKTVTVEHVAAYGTATTPTMPRRRSTAGWRRSGAVRASGDARSLGAQPSAARPGGARGDRRRTRRPAGHVAKVKSRSRLPVREPRRVLRG
jgi:hypothetical protein